MAVTTTERFRIGRNTVTLLAILLLLLALLPSAGAENGTSLSGISIDETPVPDVLFFYGETCPHCENVRPVIEDITKRYPEVTIRSLEVYQNATNRDLFLQITASHNTTAGVPALLVGDTLLLGETEIRNDAEQKIILLKETQSGSGNTTTGNDGNCPATVTTLTMPLVIGCAIVDSINPCGLAVLVFLLITMTAAGSRKRTLLVGGAYIFAMFLFHLLVGIGLFSIFTQSGYSKTFSIIGGLIAILFGLINIADLIRNKETFFLSIPESRKKILGDYTRMATLPAAFILGILAGILGFTCTGGIYISILGLMGQGLTFSTGFMWLLLYNLVFILPLIGITLLVAYGVPPERADLFRTSYKRPLRVIISVVLIALGVIILLGWMG